MCRCWGCDKLLSSTATPVTLCRECNINLESVSILASPPACQRLAQRDCSSSASLSPPVGSTQPRPPLVTSHVAVAWQRAVAVESRQAYHRLASCATTFTYHRTASELRLTCGRGAPCRRDPTAGYRRALGENMSHLASAIRRRAHSDKGTLTENEHATGPAK